MKILTNILLYGLVCSAGLAGFLCLPFISSNFSWERTRTNNNICFHRFTRKKHLLTKIYAFTHRTFGGFGSFIFTFFFAASLMPLITYKQHTSLHLQIQLVLASRLLVVFSITFLFLVSTLLRCCRFRVRYTQTHSATTHFQISLR